MHNIFKKFTDASGAGKPPQYETKLSTLPPPVWISSKHSTANKWSMPGSRPTSLTTVIPTFREEVAWLNIKLCVIQKQFYLIEKKVLEQDSEIS